MTPGERERIEADFTAARGVELVLDPVRGSFDSQHLREINRRLFQDLPGAGFTDVTPGQYRPPVPEGKDWMKNRGLATVEGSFYVAYSRMDEQAQARLDTLLASVKVDELRKLNTEQFTKALATLYTELDYIHPFSDGNSRTLRTFTRQLAQEAGFEIAWERFAGSPTGKDLLYIARDLSVNQLAKPHIEHENSMRKITYTLDRLAGNRDLADLLKDVVRPHPARELDGSQKTLIHQHAVDRRPSHAEALRRDVRYAQHTSGELSKVAYFRGVHERAAEIHGQPSNLSRFDEVFADRGAVRKLPELDDQAATVKPQRSSREEGYRSL